MTLKESVLNTLIENHPIVKTHLIHHPADYPFTCSADVRFRELRKEHGLNIVYMASKKSYRINTKKSELKKILKTIAA